MANEDIESIASIVLANSAIQAALIRNMKRLGLIDEAGEIELYEQALLLLETQQAGGASEIFDDARELIEQHLRR